MNSSSKVNLKESLGIIFGPRTSTFQRRQIKLDDEWLCFSLVFRDRTLDISALDDQQLMTWFLGLQSLVCKDKQEMYT